MIVWFARPAAQAARSVTACLREQRDGPLTHDNLFHSVLGLLGIAAAEYQPGLDAFASCRAP